MGQRDQDGSAAARWVSHRKLAMRLALAITAVVLVGGSLYLVWNHSAEQQALENKVLAETRTLAIEMQAVWDYVDASQFAINTNADGTYDFKGIYCAVAGKGIAKRFTRSAPGYVVRYVREDPRTASDEPDVFEAAALAKFEEEGPGEVYERTEFNGAPAFRYVLALAIEHGCLECHGDPAGEKDEVGFIKEGMQLGDIAGAVSIVVPMGAYEQEMVQDTVRSFMFFLALLAAIVTSVFLILRHYVVEPLSKDSERLQTESRQKTDLLATMSHELRTPLASIMAFTEIWERSGVARRPEEERLVREIRDNSNVLLGMVNDTIDVARLEQGRYELSCSDVDICDVMNAVFAVAEPLAVKRGVALSKTVDMDIPIFTSDWEALRKIVLNLVGNAIKFTEDGGSVHVSAVLLEDSHTMLVQVTDTGCGIAPDDLERIFCKFSQAKRDRCSAREDGDASDGDGRVASSGLGLYLVRTLTEVLGGTVSVVSELGSGSTFSVTLPIVESGEGEEED